jgi:hypothetical protein
MPRPHLFNERNYAEHPWSRSSNWSKKSLPSPISTRHGKKQVKRRRLKKAIIRQVARVVDWLRDVSIKTQCFIQFYVLHKLTQGQVLLPSVFTPNCIYGFMQLILGLPITNNGILMPQDRQHIFNMYLNSFDEPE